MKRVKEEPVDLTDRQKKLLPKVDFTDVFSTTNHKNSIEEICHLIFNSPPKWITTLFEIRNSLVKLIGLKTAPPKDYTDSFKVDGYVSFFKIYSIAEHEVIMGANDSHLNFRAIVLNSKEECYNIKVITLVEYNNLTGKIYMTIVKPFHRIVVKRMVSNAFTKNTK